MSEHQAESSGCEKQHQAHEDSTAAIFGTTGVEARASDVGDANEVDDQTYPTGIRLLALTIALMFATFMVALDTAVIGTAIPVMTTQFHSLNDIGWYGSAYLLALMALQPLYGKIYQFFITKWCFLLSLLLFEVGSVVCATAPSSPVFIIGRAISGSGAAGIMSGSLTIGANLVPLAKRPLYMSIIMSMYGVAALAGPTLGGIFTDSIRLTWRFCFYLNLPCGALTLAIAAFLLEPVPPSELGDLSIRMRLNHIDFPGVVLFILASALLLLPMKWGGLDYSWQSPQVLVCLIGSMVCLAVFAVIQSRQSKRILIPRQVLLQRTVLFGSLFVCFLNMAIDTHIYYLPLYFQAVDDTTALISGIRMLPYLGSMIVTAVVSGACVPLLGYYVPFMILGSALFTIGSGLIHTLDVDSGPALWVTFLVLTGVGCGMSFQIPYSALHFVLGAKDLPTGNALILSFQALGGALAVSIAQNILNNELLAQLRKVPAITNPEAIVNLGAARIRSNVPIELRAEVVHVYRSALSQTYLLPTTAAGLAFVCSLAMEWKRVKRTRADGSSM